MLPASVLCSWWGADRSCALSVRLMQTLQFTTHRRPCTQNSAGHSSVRLVPRRLGIIVSHANEFAGWICPDFCPELLLYTRSRRTILVLWSRVLLCFPLSLGESLPLAVRVVGNMGDHLHRARRPCVVGSSEELRIRSTRVQRSGGVEAVRQCYVDARAASCSEFP
jgi:hypothetical protein